MSTAGFKSAWRTVLAADLVSLVGAVLLYLIAIGDVKGFAFFLGLSTLLDIFVTWFYTRPLVILLGRNERITEAATIGHLAGPGRAGSGSRGVSPSSATIPELRTVELDDSGTPAARRGGTDEARTTWSTGSKRSSEDRLVEPDGDRARRGHSRTRGDRRVRGDGGAPPPS